MVTSIVNLSLPVDDPNRVINIQGYQAESYSESPSQPNFDSIDINGRSSPIAYYNGGSARTISFSMLFHRDMVAPLTSAGTYGGMPAGIEAEDSQYAGLYLGSDQQGGMSIEEMKKKFVSDYLNYLGSEGSVVAKGIDSGEVYKIGYLGKNQRAFKTAGGYEVWTYEDNGSVSKKEYYSYRNTDEASVYHNLKAEADATARFHIFLNKLKALNYPVYSSNGIIPPKVYLKIGGDSNNGLGGLRLKGYCTTNVNYDGLVKYNSLISATVDFNFIEVVDIAWSAPEVINGMQRYVQWMDPTIR